MPAAARVGDNIKQDAPHCHTLHPNGPCQPPAPSPTRLYRWPSPGPAWPLCSSTASPQLSWATSRPRALSRATLLGAPG